MIMTCGCRDDREIGRDVTSRQHGFRAYGTARTARRPAALDPATHRTADAAIGRHGRSRAATAARGATPPRPAAAARLAVVAGGDPSADTPQDRVVIERPQQMGGEIELRRDAGRAGRRGGRHQDHRNARAMAQSPASGAAASGGASAAGSADGTRACKPKRKVAPAPRRLSTVNRPPMRSTSCRAMVRPIPAPLPLRAAEAPRSKGRKMRSRSSAAMPSPVSATAKSSAAVPSSAVGPILTESSMRPSWVWRAALARRLSRIWRSRPSSNPSTATSEPVTVSEKALRLRDADTRPSTPRCSRKPGQSTGAGASGWRPARPRT